MFGSNKAFVVSMLAAPKNLIKREYDRLVKRDLKTVHRLARQITLNHSTRGELESKASVGQTLL